jgi:hypothetical protein
MVMVVTVAQVVAVTVARAEHLAVAPVSLTLAVAVEAVAHRQVAVLAVLALLSSAIKEVKEEYQWQSLWRKLKMVLLSM